MAKAAKKPTGGAKGKKPVAKKPAKGKKGNGKPRIQLTWLAMGLLGVTFLWFLIAGYIATSDLMARRANCIDWLVGENRAEHGYKRVFNTDSVRFGCTVQKLGLRGFIAEPPIYPDINGLLLVFFPPATMMGFYLLAFKFRRGWILRQKKKVWAKAGPLDLDDFEDMRDLPSEAEIKAIDDAAAAEEAEKEAAAMRKRQGEETAADKAGKSAKKPAPKSADKGAAEKPKATAAKPAPKPAEPEKPEAELSELEKILRQVDD
ncbi:MAG: hypothetical protein HN725_15290 [Alphaproteobacteria bacterium]|jgi:hypothetical protein|nr:hypothetical protein [Alphaproteobacteria bacterium]MBT4083018.1 hypothetical protein [Alphaproteobacteria bacterium]MBT4543065.1 hypothetical protein [Alphaproteobacteria bacterium]MBT7746654.1 hypothetical protein [Alphaproteobacteria bacterium]